MMSCAIPGCSNPNSRSDLVRVRRKGYETLLKVSQRRADEAFRSQKLPDEGIWVHERCRKSYTSENVILSFIRMRDAADQGASTPQTSTHTPTTSKLRSSASYELHGRCLFCYKEFDSQELTRSEKQRRIQRLCDESFKDRLLILSSNRTDMQSRLLYRRLANVTDLDGAPVLYHRQCCKRYQAQRENPRKKSGRPFTEAVNSAMELIYKRIESSEECQFSLKNLINDLETETGEVPTIKTVKIKLYEKYGDDIHITTVRGSENVACFRRVRDRVLTDAWYHERLGNIGEERLRIVRTAADIILEDLRSTVNDVSTYPPCAKFLNNVDDQLPESLKILLEGIICTKKSNPDSYKKKCTAIGHCIASAARPNSFCSPLQLSTSLYFHHQFGSKMAVNVLHKLGFGSSYTETRRYELSSVMQHEDRIRANTFCQFVYDNADFNAVTLDGFNTMHVMGGIRCVTPATDVLPPQPIDRLRELPTAEEVAASNMVPIDTFEGVPLAALSTVRLADVDTSMYYRDQEGEELKPEDVLWFCGKMWGADIGGWNGFMMHLHKDKPYEMTSIAFQPFIDLPATNYDCILTALSIARKRVSDIGQKTTIVTFDQPLFIKASDIVRALSMEDVVIRLGGFHTLMSYLGCIGYLMAGSGLKEVLSIIYAPNSVEKMLSGHAYARAIRAHMLLHEILARLILEKITDITAEEREIVLQMLACESLSVDVVRDEDAVRKILEKFEVTMQEVAEAGATAQLWIQYFRMVTLLKNFIRAERAADWHLHLTCIRNMIPYFHAAGHFPYAKSAHLYLQNMLRLHQQMPVDEYEKFTREGYFSIRRTDKFWSGLATDQTIETTLMRCMKTSGGITRGRSTTESIKVQWVLNATSGKAVCDQVEDFCELSSGSTEQHTDWRESRRIRDARDVGKLMDWFRDHDPFPKFAGIMSIANGVIGAEPKISCHRAYQLGKVIMADVVGQFYNSVKLKKCRIAQPLAASFSSINTRPKKKPSVIEPLAIFQRISLLAEGEKTLMKYFTFELAPFPLSLFDEDGMRKTNKAELFSLFTPSDLIENQADSFVIDGGFLLHRVVWSLGKKYGEIAEMYVKYVTHHYGPNSHIVFDGYTDVSLKSAEHQRRYQKTAPDVLVVEDHPLMAKQELFLANSLNKSSFIQFLCGKLEEKNIRTSVATGDADVLIVNTAVQLARQYDGRVILVGEDVDLLVILIATCTADDDVVFLKPARGAVQKQLYALSDVAATAPDIQQFVLFAHAFTGCDSTSATFKKGKVRFFNQIKESEGLKTIADTFSNPDTTKEEIVQAGCAAFNAWFGNTIGETLNRYRYTLFKRAVTKKSSDLRTLCPTEGAAQEHAYRVYAQVQAWLGHNLPPEQWGWKKSGHFLVPNCTTQPPAPDTLLKKLFCGCKRGCKAGCGCRKLGLKCTQACTSCHGHACLNCDVDDSDSDEPEEE